LGIRPTESATRNAEAAKLIQTRQIHALGIVIGPETPLAFPAAVFEPAIVRPTHVGKNCAFFAMKANYNDDLLANLDRMGRSWIGLGNLGKTGMYL